MLVIALTGGIGSGKTTVSEIFKAKNIPIIDTDVIARSVVNKDEPAYDKIVQLFGKEILGADKNIDRQLLRELIFSSTEKRLQLESILHPIIWDEVKSQLSLLSSDLKNAPPYCIVVVPLLFEKTSQLKPIHFDRILVIDVPQEIQIKRTKERDNCSETTIENIIENQVSRDVRVDAADDIILNTENLDYLNSMVEKLHNKYIKLAK